MTTIVSLELGIAIGNRVRCDADKKTKSIRVFLYSTHGSFRSVYRAY